MPVWQFGICGVPWHQRRQQLLASYFLQPPLATWGQDTHPLVCMYTNDDLPLQRAGTKLFTGERFCSYEANASYCWASQGMFLPHSLRNRSAAAGGGWKTCTPLLCCYTKENLPATKGRKANSLMDTILHWHKREFGWGCRETKTHLCIRTHTGTKQFHDLLEEGGRWQETPFLKRWCSRPDNAQGWTVACLHKHGNKRPTNKQTNKNILHQKLCIE